MDMKKRIIRVFPTKTNATPTDELVRIRETPSFFDEADEVHVSVTFTWDIPIAEWLAKQWEPVATAMAMLFRDLEGKYSTDWRRFQRQWANPTITICNCIKHFGR